MPSDVACQTVSIPAWPSDTILFLGCLVLQTTILFILGDLAPTLLQLQLCFDPQRFRSVVSGWSADEARVFRAHFLPDFVYPALYGLWLHRRVEALSLPAMLGRAAALGAACDVMENILHVRAFAMGSSAPDQLIIAASLLACTKWALLLPVLLAVLVSSVTARSGKAGSYAAREGSLIAFVRDFCMGGSAPGTGRGRRDGESKREAVR